MIDEIRGLRGAADQARDLLAADRRLELAR